jgi:hypothetical protein
MQYALVVAVRRAPVCLLPTGLFLHITASVQSKEACSTNLVPET